jgi:hypothetical protein
MTGTSANQTKDQHQMEVQIPSPRTQVSENKSHILYLVKWFQFKLEHYACKKSEFREMLLVLTKNERLTDAVMKNFYKEKSHDSMFYCPLKELSMLGDKSLPLPSLTAQGKTQGILNLQFNLAGHFKALSMVDIAVWRGSLTALAESISIKSDIFARALLWTAFKHSLFCNTTSSAFRKNLLNPMLIGLLSRVKQTPLPHGKIEVMGRVETDFDEDGTVESLIDNSEHARFYIQPVLHPQNLGQMDLEDINWQSMINFYPLLKVSDCIFFVKMLRMFGSIFEACFQHTGYQEMDSDGD